MVLHSLKKIGLFPFIVTRKTGRIRTFAFFVKTYELLKVVVCLIFMSLVSDCFQGLPEIYNIEA